MYMCVISLLVDYFATPGVCGLLNLGNTCYMNAGLQCVFGVKRIAKFYISEYERALAYC